MSIIRPLYILIIVAFVLELLSFAGLTSSIHSLVYGAITGQIQGVFWTSSLVGGWLFSLLSDLDTTEQKIRTTLAGLFLAAFLALQQNVLDLWSVLGAVLTGLGIVGFIRLAFNAINAPTLQGRRQLRNLIIEAALVPGFVVISSAGLSLTTSLRPYSYDFIAYRLDLALIGNEWITALVAFVQTQPILNMGLRAIYLLLPLFMLWIRFEQHRSKDKFHVNAINAFMYVAGFGYALYLITPVSGPIYAFGQYFPGALPTMDQIPARLAPTLALAPRNGIPSLHMAWGMMIFLCSLRLGLLYRVIAALLMILTAVSALAFGEHYLIDVLIAVPFAFVIYLLAQFSETGKIDKWLLASCAAAAFIMIGTVMFWPGITEHNYFYTFVIFLLLPVLCAYKFSYSIKSFLTNSVLAETTATDEAVVAKSSLTKSYEHKLFYLFILSGFAALVYQVLFAKKLALIFGSAAIATYTVLATYMAGIALGSVLGGWLGERVALKIKTYAMAELMIAIYCLISPLLFTFIHTAYLALAGNTSPDASILSFYRVLLGGIVLLIPTLAMGMTTPLLVAAVTRNKALGDSVGLLYGANTLGAAAGALLTGYLILPVLGIQKTLLVAVALNLLACAIALQLQKQYSSATDANTPSLQANAALLPTLPGKFNVIFFLLFAVGFVTLALETFYIQLLAVVAGNSAYAFSLMLFSFLLGLSGGAMTCRWLMKKITVESAAYVFAGFILVALAILLGNYGWDNLPSYFLSFENHPYARSFASREVIRGIVCFIMMFPVAYAIGFMYPASMDIVGKCYPATQALAFGIGSAINTLGNILGVVIGGFILLPALGAFNSLLLAAAAMALCAALIAVFLMPRSLLRYTLPVIALAVLLYFMQPPGFNMTRLASGANVYFSSQNYGDVIDHAESIDGGLTTVSISGDRNNPTLTLLTNGKFQGDNSREREMAAQVGFALAPLLHQTQRESALVIGYGTGVSARSISDAGFGKVEIVELSKDIFSMADKYFYDVNDNVRARSNTQSFVTDGRNFLFLHEKKYDLISMEISSIWFAGAANLYNAEFYDLAKTRLKDDGVFQQWVQLHRISEMDIITILSTVRSKFQYVWLYYIGGQGIIVATNDPLKRPSHDSVLLLNETKSLTTLLNFYGGKSENILKNRVLDPQATDTMLSSFVANRATLLSTDDNLTLEYTTPKGNVRTYQSSVMQNLEFLAKFAPGPDELYRGTLISLNKP